MIDYHTHTALCKHAVGGMEDYIESAIKKGLIEIGVSCHNPMPEGYDLEHRMTAKEFDEIYTPGVKKIQEKYAGAITVKFGVEVDFYPGTESYVSDFIARHEFDYVIGSVHYLGAWPTTELIPVPMFERVVVYTRYTEYFERVQQLAESRICDIIAHFDLVKKNGVRPEADNNGIDKSIQYALMSIKENNLCIEINTSGLRKKVAEVYPAENILRLAGKYGIPLTTGSDAHKPQDVAADFDLAYAMIEKYSNGKISLFTNRNRTEVAINELVGDNKTQP